MSTLLWVYATINSLDSSSRDRLLRTSEWAGLSRSHMNHSSMFFNWFVCVCVCVWVYNAILAHGICSQYMPSKWFCEWINWTELSKAIYPSNVGLIKSIQSLAHPSPSYVLAVAIAKTFRVGICRKVDYYSEIGNVGKQVWLNTGIDDYSTVGSL